MSRFVVVVVVYRGVNIAFGGLSFHNGGLGRLGTWPGMKRDCDCDGDCEARTWMFASVD